MLAGVYHQIAVQFAELHDTPQRMKEKGGVRRIVGSGACLIRNQVLQREIQEQYRTKVTFVEEGNACIGAAMAVADRFGDMH